MASQPTFDLQVPGRPDLSAMDHFAKLGFDCWCVDMEGYGRSTKDRDNNAPISFGADDCYAAALYIRRNCGAAAPPRLRHFVRRACARRCSPSAIRRWSRGSRSTPWCGPAKARRRSNSAARSCRNSRRRTAGRSNKAFIHSVFDRDHPDTAERHVIEAFAEAVVRARRFGADRHLRRHVLASCRWSIRRRSRRRR